MMQALAPLLRAQVALGRSAAAQRSSEELHALVDVASQGAFPLGALAGAAMHRGDGAAALSLARQGQADPSAATGAAFELSVVVAMASAQLGRLDDAVVALEAVHEQGEGHPFWHGVAAVVFALLGDPDRAIECAEIVEAAAGATYLDRVLAAIGAASAHRACERHGDAEREANAAVALASGVGDVVAIALATAVHQFITGAAAAATDATERLGEGWRRVLDGLRGAW
jgi:hypothetical protein